MVYRPDRFDVPEGLREAIDRLSRIPNAQSTLVRADLNQDGRPEYILLVATLDRGGVEAEYFHQDGEVWNREDMFIRTPLPPGASVAEALESGEVRVVMPPEPLFHDLKIGGLVLGAERPG